MHGIILQQMGKGFCIGEIIYGDNLSSLWAQLVLRKFLPILPKPFIATRNAI